MSSYLRENITLSTAGDEVTIELHMIVFPSNSVLAKFKNTKGLFHFKTINDLA